MKKLPDAELEVMQIIWTCQSPVQRFEIEEKMNRKRNIAQTTLLTMLTRLADKGFLKIEKNGRSSQYIPLISKHEYNSMQSRNFINQLFQGNMKSFATALCDSGISREDLEELKEMLEKNLL